MSEFIVMERAARMPATCWRGNGRYRRVAVVEVEAGASPRMISNRSRGVVRVVQTWDGVWEGKTDRCAAARAREEALRLARQLEGERA